MSSELILHWLESWGQLTGGAVWALAAMFVVAAFIPVPRTILVVGAGAVFGMSSLFVIVPSTTLGCILAFQLTRVVFRTWVERQVAKRRLWRILAQAVDAEGWRIVALMRFWGPLPNSAQNYLFSLTNIGLWPYAVITLVFTLPQITLYSYLGASGRKMLLGEESLPLDRFLTVVVTAVVLAVIILISRRVRLILLENRATRPPIQHDPVSGASM